MELLAQLRELLGLGADADAAAVVSAIKGLKGSTHSVDLKSIAKAAGLKEDADQGTVLQAVQTLATAKGDEGKTILALQSELTTLGTAHKELKDSVSRQAATAAIDAAILAGKPGVKPLRDHFIARHMADPVAVAKELEALPSLTGPSGARTEPPAKDKDGKPVLNAEEVAVAKALGVPQASMQATLAAEMTA